MPPITHFTLNEALQSVGAASILLNLSGITGAGDQWQHLGALEGDRNAETPYTRNDLTAPEQTGEEVAHQTLMNLGAARITASVIAGDAELWAKISPFGIAGGGYSSFRQPREFAAVIMPVSDIGDGLWWDAVEQQWNKIVDGQTITGEAAAPRNAIWFPRAIIEPGSIPYSFANGGKSLVPITIHGLFYGAAPEGYKLFAIGDPNRAGVAYGVKFGSAPA